MSHVQHRYFFATAVAIAVAVILKVAQVPSPWPAAIAIYTYGMVAWPVIREEMLPNVNASTYAAIWGGAALFVLVMENLGSYAGW